VGQAALGPGLLDAFGRGGKVEVLGKQPRDQRGEPGILKAVPPVSIDLTVDGGAGGFRARGPLCRGLPGV
jgi:hypothetical protein